jgi:pyruvate kinase|tara:strand:+ start:133 stop:267 length:135 start_codon:yes stop_codon:yes gene_type:complete
MINEAEAHLLAEVLADVGENLVILAGTPVTARAETNLSKLHRVG